MFGFRTGAWRSVFTQSLIGLHPVAWSPYIRVVTGVPTRPIAQLIKGLVDLAHQRAARHRHDHMLRESPAEILGDFITHRLGTLGVERPEVDVHESPVVLEGNLGAEAVFLVVGAVHTDDVRAVNAGAEDLGFFQIRRDEDVALQASLAALAATLLARFPVLAKPTVVKPNSRALLRATLTTRSLNESVGKLTASFLIQSVLTPRTWPGGQP